MTEITFALIRSQNPEISKVEDIEEIDCIRLINCNIHEIDNLELFHHINELYLSYNQIQSMNNLSILYKLKILDISYNNITSESLKNSIPNLPKSILSINLTGNPCVEDENVLGELQDALPEAIIAIDIETEEQKKSEEGGSETGKEEEEEEEEEEGNLSAEEDEGESNGRNKSNFLDSEDILKSIVERKCKMQNTTSSFSLNAAVQELNLETERLIEDFNRRRHKKEPKGEIEMKNDEFAAKLAERKQELIERNQDRKAYDYHEVLDRIRDNATKRLQEIKIDHELSLSKLDS